MQRSWRSMLRTIRAAAVVILVGGIAITVPPQMHDMLAFLDDGRIWPAVSFQLALIVLGGSAWFWSRAALAARFGIDDRQRQGAGTDFNWTVFTWLPRLMLGASFLIGVVIALANRSLWSVGGAACLGVLAIILSILRPRARQAALRPAPRSGFRDWLRRGAWARAKALLQQAPFGPVPATTLLALGLLPLALGMIEAFTFTLRLPNRLAAVFPGPGCAVLLLGLMIGPLTILTFVVDGLTFQARLGRVQLRLRRPPVLSILFLYVFVLVPAWFSIHTVRMVPGAAAERQPLDKLFAEWTAACAPPTGPVQPIIVAISGGATRAGLWGAAVLDQVLQAQRQGGPALFAVSSVSGGSLGAAGAMTLLDRASLPCRANGLASLRPAGDAAVPLAGDALGPLLGGWLLDDIPRSAFDPVAALVNRLVGHRPSGGDSAEAIEHGFEDLWSRVGANGDAGSAEEWAEPFLSLFYTDRSGTYRKGMPLWFANGTDAATGNRVITAPIAAPGPLDAEPWPFRGARDFHALMGGDISIATAINNTARFPYLRAVRRNAACRRREAGRLARRRRIFRERRLADRPRSSRVAGGAPRSGKTGRTDHRAGDRRRRGGRRFQGCDDLRQRL